jgi:hypothetical protein
MEHHGFPLGILVPVYALLYPDRPLAASKDLFLFLPVGCPIGIHRLRSLRQAEFDALKRE